MKGGRGGTGAEWMDGWTRRGMEEGGEGAIRGERGEEEVDDVALIKGGYTCTHTHTHSCK